MPEKVYKIEVSESTRDSIIRALEACEKHARAHHLTFKCANTFEEWTVGNQPELETLQLISLLKCELCATYKWKLVPNDSAE